jgi:hypothetical protein
MLMCVVVVLHGVVGAVEMTTVRVFHLEDTPITVQEAANAIQPLLSESGSLTVQPHQLRVIVQDKPDVLARVSEVLDSLNRSPERFSLHIELLEATNEPLQRGDAADVDDRIRRTFQYAFFRRIGVTLVEGNVGDAAVATLGGGYQVRFMPDRLPSPEEFPWGITPAGTRIHIDRFTLTMSPPDAEGEHRPVEVLRTSLVLAPSQRAIFGASGSEKSNRALVLILTARSIGDS